MESSVFHRLRESRFMTTAMAALRRIRKRISQWRHRRILRANYTYDYERFTRHGSSDRSLPLPSQQQAFLLMLTHSVEKGLAMPAPRPGFGQDKLRILLDRLESYIQENGDDWASQTGIKAVEAYLAFHSGTPVAASLHPLATRAAALKASSRAWRPDVNGGTIPLRPLRATSRPAAAGSFPIDEFLRARHSIRNFRNDDVPQDAIFHAVELAQTAPSVCNRQSGRVHVIPRSSFADQVLELQDGNRGFGNTASHILVITVDLRCFLSIGERNQMWVDGGLFAMTLVYALHGLGVGTCLLNWSADMSRDLRLRQRLSIPEWENVVTMLAIGYVPESAQACVSQRRPLDEVLRFHGETDAGVCSVP